MLTTVKYFRVVSNRPRTYMASNYPWGSGAWSRDIHHIAADPGHKLYHGARTLCGRDCSDWLIIDDREPAMDIAEASAREATDLCKRCAARASDLAGS